MNSKDVVARLAVALEGSAWHHQRLDIADVLLPVVREIADQRAAEAEARGYERGRRELAEYLVRVYDISRADVLRGELAR